MNPVVSTKKFVVRHKTAIAVVATVTVCYVVHHAALKQHNDFLKENNLFDEFYTPAEQ